MMMMMMMMMMTMAMMMTEDNDMDGAAFIDPEPDLLSIYIKTYEYLVFVLNLLW